MGKNDLKTAWRAVRKKKEYSLLNIAGLAVGMAFCLLMLLYVRFEIGYDRHFPDADNIFRIASNINRGDRSYGSATVPSFIKDLEKEFPEVSGAARLTGYSWREAALVSTREKSFYEKGFFLADPSFVKIFRFPPVHGDPFEALRSPEGIIITESAAEKYFGEENPIGKLITVRQVNALVFEVRCVIEDIPDSSHFHFDFLAPITAARKLYWENYLNDWSSFNFYTYIRLRDGSEPRELENNLPVFLKKYQGDRAEGFSLFLQPLTSIHLHSRLSGEIEPNGDIADIAFFSILGLMVLIIAGINYVNLATARSAERAKEIGMRKVLGAGRRHLISQLLGESVLQSFLALPAALLLVEVFLPVFSGIVDKKLKFPLGTDFPFTVLLLGTVLAVGLLSGLYPAFVTSAYRPDRILRDDIRTGASRSLRRNALVFAQSAVSIILIVSTIVVFRQMRFIKNEDLGFSKKNIVIVPMKDYESQQKYPLFKQEFGRGPHVLSVTASEYLPFEMNVKHLIEWEGRPAGEKTEFLWNNVDSGFFKTYGIRLKSGKGFSVEDEKTEGEAYIVNERAVHALGWASPLEKRIRFSNQGLQKEAYGHGHVIGVVTDFHMRSLHSKKEPLVMKLSRERLKYIAVRLKSGQTRQDLDFLESAWKRINPERPFEAFFFEDELARLYRPERRLSKVIAYSSLLSIFVACLGLFGLVSFSAVQRTKEIGIRKALGASSVSILFLFGRNFLIWVLWANVVAWPLAYFFMNKWLNNFAYRVSIGWTAFPGAALLTLIVTGTVVALQAFKFAKRNPVEALRYE